MTISLHKISVYVFARRLRGLSICLGKTQTLYAEKKYDEATLLNYRFFPDMFNFTKQVQSTTDHALGCAARLAGSEPPQNENKETSLAALIARIDKAVEYLDAVKPEQIDGAEDKVITVKRGDTETKYSGLEFVLNRAMPNFYFHVTTAYDIMRHNGVEIGKRNFMGEN